jgi:2-oxoglutarate ferredoxin oxidoreductase subunit delta
MDLERAGVPQGEVHVIAERCKECGYCIEYCPEQVLVYTRDINSRGYHFPMVAEDKAMACVLCKFCDLICPELAIHTSDVSDPEAKS